MTSIAAQIAHWKAVARSHELKAESFIRGLVDKWPTIEYDQADIVSSLAEVARNAELSSAALMVVTYLETEGAHDPLY